MVCDLLTYFLCNVALIYKLIWYFFEKLEFQEQHKESQYKESMKSQTTAAAPHGLSGGT
jgi:hypothetical protein